MNDDGVMVCKWKDKQGDSVKWVNEDGVMVCKWKDKQGDSVKWVNEDGVMVCKWKDKQGDSVKWVNEDGVMVCKWKDKRDVFKIATNDAGEDVTRRHPQMINLPVPTCVGRYNTRTLSISTKCARTTVWDELAGVGGSTSSGGFSTSASSMRMCSG